MNLSDLATHLAPALKRMLATRGYQEVLLSKIDGKLLARASGQTQATHPRPLAECVVLVDVEEKYVGKEVASALSALQGYAETNVPKALTGASGASSGAGAVMGLHETTSLMYIYQFPRDHKREIGMHNSYHTMTAGDGRRAYHLEVTHINLFDTDWTQTRSTKDWLIQRTDEFIIGYSAAGVPIPVDRPPTLLSSDPCIKYLGGRPGDFVSFRRLEDLQVGPRWTLTMARVGASSMPTKEAVEDDGEEEEEEEEDDLIGRGNVDKD